MGCSLAASAARLFALADVALLRSGQRLVVLVVGRLHLEQRLNARDVGVLADVAAAAELVGGLLVLVHALGRRRM